MLNSMTAYAQHSQQGSWGEATWEIRSVNHRFLDINLRLPENLRSIEPQVRDMCRHMLARGKVDCSLRYTPPVSLTELALNHGLIEQLLQASETIRAKHQAVAPLNPLEVLSWPEVIQAPQVEQSQLEEAVCQLLKISLEQLQTAQAREGEALAMHMQQRLEKLKSTVETLRPQLPEIITSYQEKLQKVFSDAEVQVDEARLAQEMVLIAQKADVSEELDRICTHLNETQRILQKGGTVGRKLDFLMQELNREANTLGSKAIHINSTQAAIDLKVLIEQIREQVQNIA